MIFLFEYRKILRQKKFLIILFCCFILNLFLINIAEQYANCLYSPSDYNMVWSDISGMEEVEKEALLQEWTEQIREEIMFGNFVDEENHELFSYTGNMWAEQDLIRDVLKEVQSSTGYSAYNRQIKEDAERMLSVSVFQNKSVFSSRNIEKTKNDYAELESLTTEAGKSKGITMAVDFLPTDLIGIVMIMLACCFLFINEKQHGEMTLLATTCLGRKQTLATKIIILLGFAATICLVLYMENFLSAYITYGFGSLERAVQSVPDYQSCTYAISVKSFFAGFLFLKIGIYILFATLFLVFGLWARGVMQFVGGIFLFLGFELALWIWVPDNNFCAIIKYVNIIRFLKTDLVMMTYKNLNIFGFPVSELLVSALSIVFIIFFLILFSLKKWRTVYADWKMSGRRRGRRNNFQYGCGSFWFECLKIRKNCFAGVILAVFCLLQLFRIFQYSYFSDPDEIYYRTYMVYLSELTQEEANDYVENEDHRYDELFEQLAEEGTKQDLYNDLLPYNGWEKAREDYEQICEMWENGLPIEIVYGVGFLQLMGENQNLDLISAIILIIMLIVLLSNVFSGDHETGMHPLLFTTPNGRKKRMQAVLKVSFVYAALVFIMIYLSDFLMIIYKIGMNKFTAPLYSLQLFFGYQGDMKIFQYLLLMYLVRFMAIIVVIHGIMFFSEVIRHTLGTILICITFFVLPLVLMLLGLDSIMKISLIPLIRGNIFINNFLFHENTKQMIVLMLVCIVCVSLSRLYLYYAYSDKK